MPPDLIRDQRLPEEVVMRRLPVASAVLVLSAAVAAGGCTTSKATPSAKSTPMPTASTSPGASASVAPPSGQDRVFLSGAADAAQFEISAGKLAANRAADRRVREFGNRMVRDHGQEYQQLRTLGRELGMNVSATTGAQERDMLSMWSSMRGGPFDCSYAPVQYLAHADVVAGFESEASSGTNQRIREFAANELPMLRQHLDMARQNLSGLNCSAKG
jgi:putative membrane protein